MKYDSINGVYSEDQRKYRHKSQTYAQVTNVSVSPNARSNMSFSSSKGSSSLL